MNFSVIRLDSHFIAHFSTHLFWYQTQLVERRKQFWLYVPSTGFRGLLRTTCLWSRMRSSSRSASPPHTSGHRTDPRSGPLRVILEIYDPFLLLSCSPIAGLNRSIDFVLH